MKAILLISIFFFLSAAPYQPYVDSFEKLHGKKISTQISIVPKFSDSTLSKDAVGVCYYSYPRKIELLSSFWKSSSNLTRRSLIFHELGHCELERGHFDKEEQTFPLSLMRYMLMTDAKYGFCKAEYDNELFTFELGPLLKCIDRYWNRNRK